MHALLLLLYLAAGMMTMEGRLLLWRTGMRMRRGACIQAVRCMACVTPAAAAFSAPLRHHHACMIPVNTLCCVWCLQDLLGCGRGRLLHCCGQHPHVNRLQHLDTPQQQDPDTVSTQFSTAGESVCCALHQQAW